MIIFYHYMENALPSAEWKILRLSFNLSLYSQLQLQWSVWVLGAGARRLPILLSWLCDFRQIIPPLCATVSSFVK